MRDLPTSLEDDLFVELLEIIKPYSDGTKEYTFEANPESLSEFKLRKMKEYGVNRISLGVESTSDVLLKNMNRHHTYLDAKNAIMKAQEIGFDNINADLILGIPGSSLEQIKKDLDNLTSLGISHISCYSLTVNPNTIYHLIHIHEPSDEVARKYYDLVHDYLKDKGFIHYEVSNWAKEGYMSEHNLAYWKNDQYYGVGLGASGYIGNIRYTNTKSINQYNEGKNERTEEVVDQASLKTYMIMTNLRTIYGLDLKKYQSLFNENLFETKGKEIAELIGNRLIELKDHKIVPTYAGMMVLDQVILALL